MNDRLCEKGDFSQFEQSQSQSQPPSLSLFFSAFEIYVEKKSLETTFLLSFRLVPIPSIYILYPFHPFAIVLRLRCALNDLVETIHANYSQE